MLGHTAQRTHQPRHTKRQVHGVLIDVAWLWEEYLAIVLEESNFRHHTDRNAFPLFENVENGKLFQKVIPDYLHANGFVADAKYIPLHRFEHLDAERASAVYYKTIMYMYRFATSKGFLFHPCHANDIQEGEKNENNVIRADYMIANDKNCCLYKLGMVIPSANDFSDFVQDIVKAEGNYVGEISKILT